MTTRKKKPPARSARGAKNGTGSLKRKVAPRTGGVKSKRSEAAKRGWVERRRRSEAAKRGWVERRRREAAEERAARARAARLAAERRRGKLPGPPARADIPKRVPITERELREREEQRRLAEQERERLREIDELNKLRDAAKKASARAFFYLWKTGLYAKPLRLKAQIKIMSPTHLALAYGADAARVRQLSSYRELEINVNGVWMNPFWYHY